MKRITSMLLALVMAFALAVPAFAAETEPLGDISVTIVLQQKPQGATAPQSIDTRTVTVPAGSSVYTAVNALPGLTIIPENPVGSGQPANCTWKRVEIVGPAPDYTPTGTYGHVLNSMTYRVGLKTTVYTNNGISVVDPNDPNHGTYSGTAWGYQVGNTTPDVYMDQYVLSGGETITLSFDYSSFNW